MDKETKNKSKLKIAGVVVLYHPDRMVEENVQSYLTRLDKLYIVDNTPNKDNGKLFSKNSKIEYIPNKKNLGIAAALNIGAEMAKKDGSEWLLTMDQDSIFIEDNLDKMIEWLEKRKYPELGLLSPFHSIEIEQKIPESKLDFPIEVMTSGNIINLKAHEKIGGFKEWLFIDCVDFDYCFTLDQYGYEIIRLNRVILNHKLGDLKSKHFFGRTYVHSNHNYIRRYYMTRNAFYIRGMYQERFPDFCHMIMNNIEKDAIKIILFEKDKYRKIRNMYRGYKDYKNNIKGEYPYKN